MASSELISVIVMAIGSFIATNLDDLFILMLFFSQISDRFPIHSIVVGQYLGFSAIIICALPSFLGREFIAGQMIGLLGFFPIIIGVKQLLSRDREDLQDTSSKISHLPILKVATVTFANGGDNIGIYLPLFTVSDFSELWLTLLVFFLLVGLWCGLAYFLVCQPFLAKFIQHYGGRITPWVLIALGIYIVVENS